AVRRRATSQVPSRASPSRLKVSHGRLNAFVTAGRRITGGWSLPTADARGPRGVGLAVGLLWGVAAQLVAQGSSRLASSTLFASGGGGRVTTVGAFAAASLAFAFGELVRRGVA